MSISKVSISLVPFSETKSVSFSFSWINRDIYWFPSAISRQFRLNTDQGHIFCMYCLKAVQACLWAVAFAASFCFLQSQPILLLLFILYAATSRSVLCNEKTRWTLYGLLGQPASSKRKIIFWFLLLPRKSIMSKNQWIPVFIHICKITSKYVLQV